MPPYRRRTAYPVRRGARRRLEWATTSVTHNSFIANTPQVDDLLANFVADGGSREGLTIMRIHAQFAYAPAAVGDSLRLGMIVEGLNAPSTAGGVLDPTTSPYEPWLINYLELPGASGATVNATNPFLLDLKSKRKVQHVQETLWLSVRSASAGSVSFNGLVRVLVALP